MAVRFEALVEVFFLFLGEDVDAVAVFERVVGEVLDDHRRLLLVDKRACLQDEVFGIGLELAEDDDVDAAQDGRDGPPGELGRFGQLSDQVVLHGRTGRAGQVVGDILLHTNASPFFTAS